VRPFAAGALIALCALGVAGGARPVDAESSSEARTAAEVFERRERLADCLEYVARDLKTRTEAAGGTVPPQLLLVVDPTAAMKDEIGALQAALDGAWSAGFHGMRIGVYGMGSGEYTAPTRISREVEGALAGLAFLPMNGPKSVHEQVRRALALFAKESPAVRAVLVVTEESSEGEDDVEATRTALFDCSAAFYCVAAEAGFERPWVQEFEPRDHPELGLTERFHPEPRKRPPGELFYGSEVALGLVPYRWEFDLAQADFVWVRPPRYPVPSGFGYWSLATLCHATGGRYFVYDFAAPALSESRGQKRQALYDFSRLALLSPDLRPRVKVLKDLAKDHRAQTIVRIWEHLANDAMPIVQTLGNLERRGGTLLLRPSRPVRSTAPAPGWYADLDEVKKGERWFRERLAAVDEAIGWWESANGREREERPGEDPLRERIEADFQLLGVQLRKVAFHLHEALAALGEIAPLDVTYRRVRIVPRPLHAGVGPPAKKIDLGDEKRNTRLAECLLAQQRLAERYADTPWALILAKGWMVTFVKDVQILEPERDVRRTEPRAGDGGKAPAPAPPAPPSRPSPPPAGPKPGSGSSGPVTGG